MLAIQLEATGDPAMAIPAFSWTSAAGRLCPAAAASA
jgi:hypothetical protein